MTRIAQILFAALVAATFGAFFLAQRLKHAPPPVQHIQMADRLFSPTCGCNADAVRIAFHIRRDDDVTVQIVDRDGEPVRTLARDRRLKAYRRTPTMRWDGRTDAGRRAPDGTYRLRFILRHEGRTIVDPRAIELDTTPPHPRVTYISPNHLLPNDEGKVRIAVNTAGAYGTLKIFRTSPGRPKLMTQYRLPKGTKVTGWSGRLRGRPAPAGTYLVVVRWRDKAGNVGTSVPLDRNGLPILPYGGKLPGHGGVTVRYLEVQPPRESVLAGEVVHFLVDSRKQCYRWTIRRVGDPTVVRHSRDRVCHPDLAVHAPGEASGVYVLEVHTAKHVARVPFAVQAIRTAPALVVLPYLTWQGRNAVDTDGDGAPNTLTRGVASPTDRVLARGELPAGFLHEEGPLLALLGNRHRRFDVTTDYALATGVGPQLRGHSGVVLPGTVRWLPDRVAAALRDFVAGGGTLLETAPGSLRRSVVLSKAGTLHRPTAAADTDLFGARLGPIVRTPTTVTNGSDAIQLFAGTVTGGTGVFAGFPGYEPLRRPGPREKLVATAVTAGGATVIAAARFGRGLVIRTGLLGFADRLSSDANSAQLVLRAMDILDGK